LSSEAIRAKEEAQNAISLCGKPQGFLAKKGEIAFAGAVAGSERIALNE